MTKEGGAKKSAPCGADLANEKLEKGDGGEDRSGLQHYDETQGNERDILGDLFPPGVEECSDADHARREYEPPVVIGVGRGETRARDRDCVDRRAAQCESWLRARCDEHEEHQRDRERAHGTDSEHPARILVEHVCARPKVVKEKDRNDVDECKIEVTNSEIGRGLWYVVSGVHL